MEWNLRQFQLIGGSWNVDSSTKLLTTLLCSIQEACNYRIRDWISNSVTFGALGGSCVGDNTTNRILVSWYTHMFCRTVELDMYTRRSGVCRGDLPSLALPGETRIESDPWSAGCRTMTKSDSIEGSLNWWEMWGASRVLWHPFHVSTR